MKKKIKETVGIVSKKIDLPFGGKKTVLRKTLRKFAMGKNGNF